MDFFWTAFLLGFAGSAHCIGMCGPIAVALPGKTDAWARYVSGRVLYNAGRAVTYTMMGAVLGLLGLGAWLVGYQQALSVITGAGIVLVTLVVWNRSWTLEKGWFSGISAFFHRVMQPLMRAGTGQSMFLIGIVNGFLPCGLVYVALAAALTTGGVLNGMIYMALFGIGTAPVMFMMAVSPGLLTGTWQLRLQKAIPWLAVLVGLLLILRGLSLGIPFISPDLSSGQGSCH
ncbi:sulfite exporter TauE/SafE family protein [Balneolales bacterium ANBcel1]|nr:sulfite exporter TauE/SafE family protein [Balneolales bacterium ANBcel1]